MKNISASGRDRIASSDEYRPRCHQVLEAELLGYGNWRVLPANFDPAALDALQTLDWPGNVRELEHCIERALIFSHGAPINAALLEPPQSAPVPDPFRDVVLEEGLHSLVSKLERSLIERALNQAAGNGTRAADILKAIVASFTTDCASFVWSRPPFRATDAPIHGP